MGYPLAHQIPWPMLLPWWPEAVSGGHDVCMHQKKRLFHPMTEHAGIALGVENPTGLQARSKLFPTDAGTANA